MLRFGFIVPSTIAMLVVSYTALYRRWFGFTAQIVAPVHALSFVVMDILMHPRGYSLSSVDAARRAGALLSYTACCTRKPCAPRC